MTLKEQLEKYRKEIYGLENKPHNRDDIMSSIGFQDAVELLFPLVEALDWYSKPGNCDCSKEPWHNDVDLCPAHKALQELREKLK